MNKTGIADKNVFADNFNEIFMNVCSDLTFKIPSTNMKFVSYIPHISTLFAENSITLEEFKKAFFIET